MIHTPFYLLPDERKTLQVQTDKEIWGRATAVHTHHKRVIKGRRGQAISDLASSTPFSRNYLFLDSFCLVPWKHPRASAASRHNQIIWSTIRIWIRESSCPVQGRRVSPDELCECVQSNSASVLCPFESSVPLSTELTTPLLDVFVTSTALTSILFQLTLTGLSTDVTFTTFIAFICSYSLGSKSREQTLTRLLSWENEAIKASLRRTCVFCIRLDSRASHFQLRGTKRLV